MALIYEEVVTPHRILTPLLPLLSSYGPPPIAENIRARIEASYLDSTIMQAQQSEFFYENTPHGPWAGAINAWNNTHIQPYGRVISRVTGMHVVGMHIRPAIEIRLLNEYIGLEMWERSLVRDLKWYNLDDYNSYVCDHAAKEWLLQVADEACILKTLTEGLLDECVALTKYRTKFNLTFEGKGPANADNFTVGGRSVHLLPVWLSPIYRVLVTAVPELASVLINDLIKQTRNKHGGSLHSVELELEDLQPIDKVPASLKAALPFFSA